MDADFDRIQVLFLEALEQPLHERDAYLAKACASDDERQAVEQLLNADALDSPFLLDEPLVRLTTEDAVADVDVAGRQVGPYQIKRLLGQGGMGAVYLAEREDVGREVALKLVRGDLADPSARQRLVFERRVLARLEHPNIARLYDVGVSEDGTPYFAMEHVEGVPVTQYCDGQQLDVGARLRLFESIGRAVQHAHQHFVVHRDLKPSNIYVTPDGEIKLLDFGIAKALDEAEEMLGEEVRTRTGRRMLTPAYAAPEQHTDAPVTAASDVYSLGVVLYELLTGTRPEAASTSVTEPKRPSTVVTQSDVTSSTTAAARQTTTERLVRQLRGDLDVICLKALQPEPERRYASAEAFVEDIKRHLAGLPVMARPDSTAYRIKKFVHRHRQGVVASLVGGVVLASIVGFYTVRLQAERDRAQQELAKSREVTGFMLDLFEAGDPNMSLGDTLTARDLLDRGVQFMQGLEREPEVRAAMLSVIGQAYSNLALYAEADSVFRQALTIAQATFGGEHPVVARAQSDLARVLHATNRFEAADSLYGEALSFQRRNRRTDPLDLAETLWRLGVFERQMDSLASAERHLEESLALRRATLGDVHPDVGESLHGLAAVKWNLNALEEAESLYREALSVRRATLGEAHLDLSESIATLGSFLREKGDLGSADTLLSEALAMNRRLVGGDHPRVAESMAWLATLREYQGNVAAAESLLVAARSIYISRLGPDHLLVARETANLGRLRSRAGDLDGADRMFREALVLYRNKLGKDHSALSAMYDNLGMLLRRKKEYAEAETFFRQALAIDRGLNDHQYIALDLNRVALARKDQGDMAGAEALYREALALQRAELPSGHRDIAGTLRSLGRLHNEQGRFADAESLLRQSVAIYRDTFGDDDRETAWARTHLGISATGLNQYDQAERLLRGSLTQLERAQGASDLQKQTARAALADLYEAMGRPRDAARVRAEAEEEQ